MAGWEGGELRTWQPLGWPGASWGCWPLRFKCSDGRFHVPVSTRISTHPFPPPPNRQLAYILGRHGLNLNLEEGPAAVEDEELREQLQAIIR